MDSILFYGDRGDASRRQVRSAAAQHSHRIGPRKPKTSKNHHYQRRRSIKATSAALSHSATIPADLAPAAAIHTATVHAAASPRPGELADIPPPPWLQVASPSRPPAPLAPQYPASLTANIAPVGSPLPAAPDGAPRDWEAKRWGTTYTRFQETQVAPLPAREADRDTPAHIQPQLSLQNAPPTHPPLSQRASLAWPTLPLLQVPAAAPLATDRSGRPPAEGFPTARSRTNSQASPQSPFTRLPQYSWTEYPRFGLGVHHSQTSLQMLAQAAIEERDTSDVTRAATHDLQSVPGFRQYSAIAPPPGRSSASQPVLMPIPSTSDDMPAPGSQSSIAVPPHARPPLAPVTVQSLSAQSPSNRPSFGQFLQSAMAGQEHLEVRRRSSSGSDADVQDEKPQFSPG